MFSDSKEPPREDSEPGGAVSTLVLTEAVYTKACVFEYWGSC